MVGLDGQHEIGEVQRLNRPVGVEVRSRRGEQRVRAGRGNDIAGDADAGTAYSSVVDRWWNQPA